MKDIINIKNLNYSIKDTIIFKNFNLCVEEGKFIGIAGNNTSGKTTLIKLINGTLPSNNTISIGYSYVNNERINDHSIEIGTVYGSNLNSFLFDEVYKELAFPLENLSIDPNEIENRIVEITKFFGISRLLDKKTYDLTNSEKQEILLILALLHEPKILLLDTPFSMMNKTVKKKIMNKLLDYKKKHNLTIILTTTNLEDVLETDYLYIINDGNIVIEGKPFDVFREDTLINRLGLDMPFMVDLSLKLEFYDLLDNIEIDMNRMVNKLWK